MYVAYIDLENAYDRVDREAVWCVLGMYGINGQLLKEVQSLYEKSEACVKVCREEGEWFEVGVGLRQRCVMSLWLFSLLMDAVMKEVREKASDVDVTLWDERRHIEWKVDWLIFARRRACRRRKLSVNETKSKIIKLGKNAEENGVNISLNERREWKKLKHIDVTKWTYLVILEWVRR